jgi:hypothetical protein
MLQHICSICKCPCYEPGTREASFRSQHIEHIQNITAYNLSIGQEVCSGVMSISPGLIRGMT